MGQRAGEAMESDIATSALLRKCVNYAQPSYFAHADTLRQTPEIRGRRGNVARQDKPEGQPGQET
jgi:hypothetical protein